MLALPAQKKHRGGLSLSIAFVVSTADVLVRYSLDVDCPYCGAEMDLCDQDDDGCFSIPIFNNDWDVLEGMEATCPDCNREFNLSKVEC